MTSTLLPLSLLLPFLISLTTATNQTILPTSPHIHRLDIVPAEYMPPPWDDPAHLCQPHSYTSRYTAICDPSALLSSHDIRHLDTILFQVYSAQSPYSLISCPTSTSPNQPPHGFRIALALVRRMVFDGRNLADRAENFAHQLFANWQLDQPCAASVLLFLSLEDQRMYIQTGRLVTQYLNKPQIDHVYSKMIPKLQRNKLNSALSIGLKTIANYLRAYQGPHAPPPQPNPAPVETATKNNPPDWWDTELTIVFWLFIAFLILACCHGIGGTEATVQKREMRIILRNLNVVRQEYVAAMLPQYTPSTCPICQRDLTPPWVPTVPTLAENQPLADTTPPSLPTRTLRCGHTFFESCFDEENPTPSGVIPQCPVCGDRGGGLSTPPSLASTRLMDTEFRLKKLSQMYPHMLTDEVVAKLLAEAPDMWPERMTEGYLKGGVHREREIGTYRESGNGFWNQWGGLLAAGGIGAALASALSGWGNGRRDDQGRYSDIQAEGAGDHSGGWFGRGGSGNEINGYGTGWGDGAENVSRGVGNVGGGGHGVGWGDALAGAASRFTGSGEGFGGGWGSGNDGGGGHGTGW